MYQPDTKVHYYQTQTFRHAEAMGMNKLAAARVRARYLGERIDEWLEEGGELARHWCKEALEEMTYLEKHCRYTNCNKNDITQEQIQQARLFPIDKLIEFDRQGKALAFCHPDKAPSLRWNRKHNRAHCFPCQRSYDSIGVLMTRDKMKFVDAVRSLQ
jgi:hypothetical protein